MIVLIATLCASAAMTDCQVYTLGQFDTPQQCHVVAQVHTDLLGTGPDQNYRLDCEPDAEGDAWTGTGSPSYSSTP